MALTKEIAAFVSGLTYADLPQAAIDVAKLGFLDCSGVLIAGSAEDTARIMETTLLAALDGKPEASIVFTERRASALVAARINGTAAHALDYDDAGGHRSAILVPAILAEGEALGSTGKDMITAYVAGFEVWSELVRREDDQLHEKGWHPTGVYGAVAAAAAMANLRRLNPEETAVAIALGASQASGVVANFGTMIKPFHAGASAHAGVLAGRLAANGMSGGLSVLEHKRGFLAAVSPRGSVDRSRSATHLGRDWHIVNDGVSIKKFPTCYCTHRAIDAMLGLVAERPIRPDEVEEIRVKIGKTQAAILINHRPQTGLEAKFSIEFTMACALLEQAVTLQHLTDSFVLRPEVQKLLPKVFVDADETYDPTLTSYSPADQVSVRLTSGEVLVSEEISRARGHISRPLAREELFAKFEACLAYGGSDLDPMGAFEMFETLETLGAGWPRELPRQGVERMRA
ncbi:hypothetical protein GCM10007276_24290 [Agaricicola taiwanensis]|uniref:MmgE/PrpD family protein n=1 Tax=Agaricicola taiwanensis TaxID=591372 RepID=A0A8J3DXT1_9RHOB|nr:MmgE/PrpD family protein [Agaricicola taiwanensis]GGE46220.1 hypothetical protein GCM10007276_24290 [Agaricicola taiwanensis]